jgi:hypothetical protein
MNYSHAADLLSRGRNGQKKIANNTYLHSLNDGIAIKFHDTDIVVIQPDGTYLLQIDGFQTVTTKARINEFTPARITQKGGLWFMKDGTTFKDGVIIDEKGQPLNSVQDNTVELKKKLDKMVSKYIKGFADDAVKNGLEFPSAGGCLMCKLGSDNVDHIFSHIEESYYVPSLLFNAIKSKNYPNPGLIYSMIKSDVARGDNGRGSWIVRELTYYFRKIKPAMLTTMQNT